MKPTATAENFKLTDMHRMLLQMRDTLYEGSWEDFLTDLRSRAESRPFVFETVSVSAEMHKTIATHLAMIDDMREWERTHAQLLRSD